MAASSVLKGSAAGHARWIPWRASVICESAEGDPWLFLFRLNTFRLLAALAAVGLLIIIAQGIFVNGAFQWADLVNAVFFAFLFLLSVARPGLLRLLYWLGLASSFLNTIDGLIGASGGDVASFLVLLPLLVLYGAFLGDIWVSLTAMAGVGAAYAYTWSRFDGFDRREMLILTNLIIVTLFSGAAAISIWLRHRRLNKEFALQAAALRRELDAKSKLQALITHDIRNPLTALIHAAELDDPQEVRNMAQRIAAIVESARDLATGATVMFAEVSVSKIWIYLRAIFASSLAGKSQALNVKADPDLVVVTDLAILCNSVLGNILSNASKFSPRGATIVMTAERAEDRVRIVVQDQGPGFPDDVVDSGPDGRGYRSRPGTEGEKGTGNGMRIAALCAERLGASIEIQNPDSGGAAVSVLLPAGGSLKAQNSRL